MALVCIDNIDAIGIQNIYFVLKLVKKDFDKSKLEKLKKGAIHVLNSIEEFKLDYFEIADGETLLPATENSKSIVACTAVFIGEVRLIDNMVLC